VRKTSRNRNILDPTARLRNRRYETIAPPLQGRDVSCTVLSITKRLAEPGPSAIPYLIFHFFTEYNAPRRGPSGMFAARDCPAPLSSTAQGVRSLSVLPIA
jgi:hypothetical protein